MPSKWSALKPAVAEKRDVMLDYVLQPDRGLPCRCRADIGSISGNGAIAGIDAVLRVHVVFKKERSADDMLRASARVSNSVEKPSLCSLYMLCSALLGVHHRVGVGRVHIDVVAELVVECRGT